MALRAIEIKRQLDEKQAELRTAQAKLDGLVTRSEALMEKVEKATEEERESVQAEVEELTTEKEATEAEVGTLKEAVEQLERELEEEEANEPSDGKNPEERGLKKMENIEIRNTERYINAYAEYIKTGEDKELRSLLSENADSGVVPVPDLVGDIVRTAWDREEIMKDVNKTYMKGNVKVGFEISADDAVVHTEGTAAPDEEDLVLGIVTMVPASIKKWITVSDEALDLTGEGFLRYIYKELAYKIAKKAADNTVAAIAASPASSTATAAGQPAITHAVAQDTVVTAMGQLSDEASNLCVIMNKATYAAFKGAQYEGNYAQDIFEGLPVKFNNTLPVYSSATSGQVYAIVGDLRSGAQANFPNGDTIKFVYDNLSLAEKDLVKIVGREYVGIGVVAPKRFCLIKKPATT